jgi:hypothetical protein
MSNLDRLIDFVKEAGYDTADEVRKHFENEGIDKDTMDAIIRRLVNDGIVRDDSRFVIPTYKKAVAFFFQSGRLPMPRAVMKMEMSFKLDWFRPGDADIFIGFCIRDGFLEESDGKLRPTFDVSEVVLPYEWSLHEELGIKTGSEVARADMRKKEEKKERAYVRQEKAKESEALMVEEGMDVGSEDESDTAGGEVLMTVSHRDEFKRSMVRRLVDLGIPARSANGLFDYYELNYGLADEEMFIMTSVQFENFTDENVLKKAFVMLEREVWDA